MRILVVGGGIAGLALAGLLDQRGFEPDVVEKAHDYDQVGYVLSIWPAGSSVLKGLGLYECFANEGQRFTEYTIADGEGNVLNSYDLDALTREYGPAYTHHRANLIDILLDGIADVPIRMGTTVTEIDQTDEAAHVTFSDGSEASYDLVVGADGLRSGIRELVFGDVDLTYHDMTGWAFWVDPSFTSPGEVIEYWDAGRFFGVYPATDVLCCFVATTAPRGMDDPIAGRIDRLERRFGDMGGIVPNVLDDLEDPERVWHDDFLDLRMNRWSRGRVLLIGDASAAILPTAGVGASMAMESAAVLADELTRTDSMRVGRAIENVESRRKPRVDRVQNKSRHMGRFAMVDNDLLARVRNESVQFYSEQRLQDYWRDILSSPI